LADPSPDDLARAADVGVDRALVMVPDGAEEKETLERLDRYTGFSPGSPSERWTRPDGNSRRPAFSLVWTVFD
jgi:hypothetical protein